MAFSTTLTSDLTSTDEIMHVASNSGAPTTYPWRIKIEDEALAVTAGVEEGLDWTVLRGEDDTDPTDHLSGAEVLAVPIGQISLDTVGGWPYQLKAFNGTSWDLLPLVRKDGSIIRASVTLASEPAVPGITLAVFDELGAPAYTLFLDDTSFLISNGDSSMMISMLATGTITIGRGTASVTLDSDDDVNISTNGAIELAGGAAGILLNLPTADPVTPGALWADSGVVKVSAG